VEPALGRLFSAMQDLLDEELAALAGDAGRVRTLLGDAVGGLSKSFLGLAAQTDAQKRVLDALLHAVSRLSGRAEPPEGHMEGLVRAADSLLDELEPIGRAVSEAQARLGAIRADVDDISARAIRALQFEDIIGQLIGTVLRRVDRLRVAREAIAACLGAGAAEHGLEVLARGPGAAECSTVQQVSMTTGEIELF
jgi:hypothetical protein